MDLLYLFLTSFIVALSGAMMPGPLLTVTISESAKKGLIAVPLLILGHGLLEAVLVIALIAGFSAFLTKPSVGITIAIIGGTFLVWMGWNMARDAYSGKVEFSSLSDKGDIQKPVNNKMNPVLAGALVSLSNPYWSLWWATIGLGYITMALAFGITGVIVFFTGHILADLAWYYMIGAGIVGGKRFLKPNIYKWIIITCGLFLVTLGISFIHYGFTR